MSRGWLSMLILGVDDLPVSSMGRGWCRCWSIIGGRGRCLSKS